MSATRTSSGPKPRDAIFMLRDQAAKLSRREWRALKEKADAEGREIELETPEEFRRRLLRERED